MRKPLQAWPVRAALALICLALCYLTVTRSLASAIATKDPVRAHRLAPENGRVTARLAFSLIETDPKAKRRNEAERLATLALRQDGTAVSAASTLGMVFQFGGNSAQAGRAFKYAQSLSRRDFVTNMWAIEDSVGKGDIPGALRQYDITIRTKPAAADVLFPILASAASSSQIRLALVDMLKTRPPWGENFIRHLAASGPDPTLSARLFVALAKVGVAVSPEASAQVINTLVSRRLFDSAWSYYDFLAPGVSRVRSRDPLFSANVLFPSVFDWNVEEADGLTASIQRGESGGIFDFAASPSVGGKILQQIQLLPAGSYRLVTRSAGIDQPEQSRPYWTLTCNDGREVARVAMPNSSVGKGTSAARISVPEGCPVQTLTFIVRPSTSEAGSGGQFTQASLVPAR